jgi:hypothetical protein
MTADHIKHFLVFYDVSTSQATVKPFEEDYDAALEAYAQLEEDTRDRDDVDIVLLSADSIETVKRTHSSYFDTRETFERLLPPGVLQNAG